MIIETILTAGAWTAGITGGVSVAATAVNWIRYSRSAMAEATGNSFLKHCYKKYFQANKNQRKGYAGEYETSRQLEKVSGYKKFLFNLLLPTGKNTTSEIDILMLHETGVYVIENKNYGGLVGSLHKNNKNRPVLGNINAHDEKWGVRYGNKKFTSFYSPIKQNEKHVNVIKSVLRGFKIGSQHFFSYIVFNNDARVKGMPGDFRTSVDVHTGYSKDLVFDLSNRAGLCGKVLSPAKIDEIVSVLEPFSHANKKAQKAHIQLSASYKEAADRKEIYEKQKELTTAVPFQPLDTSIQAAKDDLYKSKNSNNKKKSQIDYTNIFRY